MKRALQKTLAYTITYNMVDEVLEEFKTWLREKGKYDLSTLEELIEAFKEFEQERKVEI